MRHFASNCVDRSPQRSRAASHGSHPRRWAALAALALTLVAGGASSAAAHQAADPAEPLPYLRTVESKEAGSIALQVAIREFAPPMVAGKARGPTVQLVGVVHIGDKAYYQKLQEFLDAQDLVLFEGVKPGDENPALALLPAADRARVRLTQQRIRALGALMERARNAEAKYPESVPALLDSLPAKVKARAVLTLADAWGRPLVLMVKPGAAAANAGADAAGAAADAPGSFEITSLGSDDEIGGEGAAADLTFSAQPPLSPQEIGRSEDGIQAQLAKALGLEFQLDAIDYQRPDWRNSDMSVGQLQRALTGGEAGGSPEADQLFGMLSGQGLGAQVAGLLLRLVGSNPQMSAMARLMVIETTSNAELMMAGAKDAAGPDRGAGPMAGLGRMMKVLIHDRNDVVFRDLREVMDHEPEIKSVALFYGAGHLPDFETRLEELGYIAGEERWLTAMAVNAKDTGMSPESLEQTRQMMKRMLNAQMRQMQPGR